jgi:uncharacterized protein
LTGYGRSSRSWSAEQVREAREQMWMPTPEMVAKEVAAYQGNWSAQMKFRVPDALQMETVYFWSFTLWRAGGLMLVGMGLFKLGVFAASLPVKGYRWMIVAGALIGIPVILYGTYRDFASGWDFRYVFLYGQQFNYWASLLVSLGWVGFVMLLCKAGIQAMTRRLAAVGRMAFSNYIMHTLICTTLFYGHGFGLFGKIDRVWQLAIVLAIWALQLVLSPIWLRHFLFGPLEWIWRSLTYWQLEPFRRERPI